jgi:nucleotide-binding universal stress UspA family protein
MKILFPIVRASNVSSILAPMVLNMVKGFKAEFHVMYVEQPTDQGFRIRLEQSKKWAESFVAEQLKEVKVHRTEVLPGDPADEILRYTDENDIDCIIIGTHGAKGLASVLFGSTANTIISKSPVPVLCLNPYLMTKEFKKRNAAFFEKYFSSH